MKKYSIRYIIPMGLFSLAMIYACKKSFLEKDPLGSLQQTTLSNAQGVKSLLIGAYAMLDGEGGATTGNQFGSGTDNWVFGSVAADDSYKGSTPSDQGDITFIQTWSTSFSNNSYLQVKWQACYDGVQRANDVLRTLALATDVTDADKKEITAEARFLRGFFHLEAKKLWKNVPYVDETIIPKSNNVNVPNDKDIWPNIEADFQFAIDNLNETQNPGEKGRANKWAAMAFLAKCYMFEHKFPEAKLLIDNLLSHGVTSQGQPYGFNPKGYEANFNPDPGAKNSAESIFSVQMSVNDGSGTNGNYGQVLNFPNDGSGPGGCCGFNNPSLSLANAYKTDANGLPLLDTYNTGAVVSAPSNPYTGSLDPRIDLVMGRPGIPYLDFGNHPGSLWVRDGTDGYFSPKKNQYAKSQKDILSSKETSFWGPTQIVASNINLIRYSDLLLWAAECEIEAGNPDKALEYVNRVRSRIADHPETWVYKNAEFDPLTFQYKTHITPADNYKIGLYPAGSFANRDYAIKAIRFERRLELAMEGQRFFDLQRWDNGTGYMADVLNEYATIEKTRPSIFQVNPGAKFTKGTTEIFAIPRNEIDLENATGTINLKQNPGYQ
ncbi:RagB/SusD family nutrient uptake outer membrane protein [Pedobacter sp. HMF7647]|uniref:RagB/SusD family nutrient uptake outer membrane protein n=1 Tax=Hufsiella arboris TaxID=2695275 RepID=A0A7K1Y8G6_9SPHI|nr:RagB/SusD family nutrient uptake outer membrane protein [Hufsiella arboris]MXV50876.1 RagB/SusD family nutrient uptake outer membrane protein [Hufsiella arboris]